MSLDINDPNPHLRPMADFLNALGGAPSVQDINDQFVGLPLQGTYTPNYLLMARGAIEGAISSVCNAGGAVAPEERAAMDAALRALLKARRHVESVLWPKVK